jgi:prevent-host-death family protein
VSSRVSKAVTIPATAVHRQFGDLIKRVFSGKEHFIVEKDGLPVAAIISKDEYDQLLEDREHQQLEKEQRLKEFEHIARQFGKEAEQQGIEDATFLEELEKTKAEIYQAYYGDQSNP